jgi:hypothetical protein
MYDHLLSKRQSIFGVPLSPQAKRLDTLNEQERGEWVQGWTQITEELNAKLDSESDSTKCLAKDHAMISLGGGSERRELAGACPVEFS